MLAQSTPSFLSQSVSTPAFSKKRPIELVTIVLRAAVQGLLKCCCLSWTELANNGGNFDVRCFFLWAERRGSNLFFPLDRRLAKRQMWNIITGRDCCPFYSFQTRRGSELVRAKRLWWGLCRLSEGWSADIFQCQNSGKLHYKPGFYFEKYGIIPF